MRVCFNKKNMSKIVFGTGFKDSGQTIVKLLSMQQNKKCIVKKITIEKKVLNPKRFFSTETTTYKKETENGKVVYISDSKGDTLTAPDLLDEIDSSVNVLVINEKSIDYRRTISFALDQGDLLYSID